VDSFTGFFDRFYYIFTGESTSKADKFDNLRWMKILNTPLTQKSPEVRTKRPEQEQTLQTKKGAISQPWEDEDGFERDEFCGKTHVSIGSSHCSAVAAFSLQVPEKCSDPEPIFLCI